jgi:pyruvate dehydrogenase E1 component
VAYDPAFSYEVAHIVRDGLRRMYGEGSADRDGADRDGADRDGADRDGADRDGVLGGENVMYYLTVYNDPYVQPAEPAELDVDGLLRGIYRYAPSRREDGPQVRLLASGVAMPWALRARDLLGEQWGVGAEVWSVTSWGELRRDGVEADHHNLVHPDAEPRIPYIARALGEGAPVVAVSDWMSAVPDLVRQWVPSPFTTLGTDGFGLSDTRPAVRRHFAVDAESVTVAALGSLAAQGALDRAVVVEAAAKYRIDDPRAAGPQTSDPGDA